MYCEALAHYSAASLRDCWQNPSIPYSALVLHDLSIIVMARWRSQGAVGHVYNKATITLIGTDFEYTFTITNSQAFSFCTHH